MERIRRGSMLAVLWGVAPLAGAQASHAQSQAEPERPAAPRAGGDESQPAAVGDESLPGAPTAAPPAPVECFPACRSGFTCARGGCVSLCTPPAPLARAVPQRASAWGGRRPSPSRTSPAPARSPPPTTTRRLAHGGGRVLGPRVKEPLPSGDPLVRDSGGALSCFGNLAPWSSRSMTMTQRPPHRVWLGGLPAGRHGVHADDGDPHLRRAGAALRKMPGPRQDNGSRRLCSVAAQPWWRPYGSRR